MEKDYFQSVSVLCSTCGGTEFSFEDENGPVHCVGCSRVFSREELVRENGSIIEAAIDEMKEQVLNDARRKIRNMLKKIR